MAMAQPRRAGQLRAELVRRATSGDHARTRSEVSSPSPPTETGRSAAFAPESFADHYSQARQFFRSQHPIEQQHIVDAFTFELSKVERPAIRERMVANLRNVDEELATAIADGLGLATLPPAPEPAASRRDRTSPPSPKLEHPRQRPGVVRRPQGRRPRHRRRQRQGRQGAPSGARQAEKANSRSSPRPSPASRSTTAAISPPNRWSAAGPRSSTTPWPWSSPSEGARELAAQPAAKDFVTDAHAHGKFIGIPVRGRAALRRDGARRADRRRLHRSERTQLGPPVRDDVPRAAILAAPRRCPAERGRLVSSGGRARPPPRECGS